MLTGIYHRNDMKPDWLDRVFLPIPGIELAHFRIELDYLAKKPMWRNGRRNGLKIRWAVTGPCRFESGHRQFV